MTGHLHYLQHRDLDANIPPRLFYLFVRNRVHRTNAFAASMDLKLAQPKIMLLESQKKSNRSLALVPLLSILRSEFSYYYFSEGTPKKKKKMAVPSIDVFGEGQDIDHRKEHLANDYPIHLFNQAMTSTH